MTLATTPANYTLIGHADKRGNAWLPRRERINGEDNFYPGAIPVKDVERRLFAWTGERRRIAIERAAQWNEQATHVSPDGVPSVWDAIESHSAVTRDDAGDNTAFGFVTDRYVIHQYAEWLLRDVSNIIGDTLSISSAGYIRHGGTAWVELSVPENIRTDRDVTFRPNLLATSSMGGGGSTIFKRTITDVVCDNTRRVALKESSDEIRYRHTKSSQFSIGSARDALDLVHAASAAFEEDVSTLLGTAVSDAEWKKFLDVLVPFGTKAKKPDTKHQREAKERMRAELDRLYRTDPRCGRWHGTAHGALQAVNTYEHHVLAPRQRDRAARNTEWTISGEFDKRDLSHHGQLLAVLQG